MEFLWNLFHQIYDVEFLVRAGGLLALIAIIRPFAPVVAGVGAMQYRRFISYNVFGGIFWVLTMTSTGYFLGRIVPNIEERIHVVIAIVIFLSLLPAVAKVIREKRKASKYAG